MNLVELVKLKDISKAMYRGNGIKRDEVTIDGTPCVRYGEIYTTYGLWFDKCISHTKNIKNPKYFENSDILFAITGESVEDIAKSTAYVGDKKCLAGGDIVVMKHNQNPNFLSQTLSTTESRNQKSKGKIKSKVVHSSVPDIENIIIPLPLCKKTQDKYANIFDKFYLLCESVEIGIPAEIKANRQRYEYYRDEIFESLKECA